MIFLKYDDIQKELDRFGKNKLKTVRLTNTCTTKACGQWDGGKCSLMGTFFKELKKKNGRKTYLNVVLEIHVDGMRRRRKLHVKFVH